MRLPGRSSVCDCAPSLTNVEQGEIITPDCRTITVAGVSVAFEALFGRDF